MNQNKQIRLILIPVITVLFIVIFHFLGNTAEPERFSKSTFIWAARRWSSYGGYFTYGYFIPFISLWLVWRKRKEIRDVEKKSDCRALIFVIGALLLQLASTRTSLPRLSMVSAICLLWSIPWYLYGWSIARLMVFPCSYLIFCVPLNFLEKLTFPLRMFAATTASHLLNGMGIENVRNGTAILSTTPDGFRLDVADPCSGLKYFLVLLALSALYAYLTQTTVPRKWFLFLIAAPVAVIGNIFRILTIALASAWVDPQIADTIYHDFSGYIVFITAVLMMMGLSAMINVNYQAKLLEWKNRQKNLLS